MGDRLKALGVHQSMTRGGSPADNAYAESLLPRAFDAGFSPIEYEHQCA